MAKGISGTRPEQQRGASELGERLRTLRVSAGLTQSQLADGRFSKEYVSQIERGKTRPSAETVEWLAARLEADPAYLLGGVSAEDRGRVEAALARAEALTEQGEHAQAARAFADGRQAVSATGASDLELRSLLGETWALAQSGGVQEALRLLNRARDLAEHPEFSDVDRASVLFRLGVCRYHLSSISTAVSLLSSALELADRSGLPCDLLRGDILDWRSRCYRRQRDWQAAREDVERALELAESARDRRASARAYFQASLVAEREGHWLLARTYAERARGHFEELQDRANVGRLLNNLGGLNFTLGNPERAVELLTSAYDVALETGDEPEAGLAMCSLAQVHLDRSEAALAEGEAARALALFGNRPDYLQGIGTAQLVLGRALLELDRLDEAEEILLAADKSFEQLSSVSHRAAAWVAQGDLAQKRNADREAARLYRRAAEALQDFRF
ncbi:MAG: helix-turn-helix domain-containing protein [Verrucomicrobiota bacterium]